MHKPPNREACFFNGHRWSHKLPKSLIRHSGPEGRVLRPAARRKISQAISKTIWIVSKNMWMV